MTRKCVKGLFILVMILALVAEVIPAFAEGADLEKVNVSWDLEPDKPVTIYTRFHGLERSVPVEFVISDMEHTKGKKGKNKLTFRITFTNDFEPTEEEISFLGARDAKCYLGYVITDYESGMCLEVKNKLGVTVKDKEEPKEKASFQSADGTKLNFIKKWTLLITIEYPEDYTGLCIGASGRTEATDSDAESKYWKGKLPFSKTCYYSMTNAELTHFMRIDPATAADPAQRSGM